MRKSVIFILLILIVLSGGYFISVYYAGKKTDEFFNRNNGVLYNHSGLKWVLTDSQKNFFNAQYQTKLSADNETLFTFEHAAAFDVNINPFNVGYINTKINITTSKKELSRLSDKEFRLNSMIKLNGIDTSAFIEGGSVSDYDVFSGEYENLTWKDINAKVFISFKKDIFSFDADIPLIKIDASQDRFFIAENQTYKGYFNKKEFDLWLGDWDMNIEKIDFSGDTDRLLLTNLKFQSQISEDKDLMLKHSNEISFDKFDYASNFRKSQKSFQQLLDKLDNNNSIENKEELFLSDIIFNVSVENLDSESIQKISKIMSEIDISDDHQLGGAIMASFGYISDIFAKHPKVVVEEFSGKISNASVNISGFAQYVGDGNLMNIYDNFADYIAIKMDFNIDENVFKEYFRKETYAIYGGYGLEDTTNFMENMAELKMEIFEDEIGIKSQNGVYNGTFEIKNGEFLLNGKIYERAAGLLPIE
ncbi:MAG: YdgA family protein [Campylobacteraceae bacterium]|jgi:hypothetical protein|nr:YdgA family protein [Campylobacteraceae bacterium]